MRFSEIQARFYMAPILMLPPLLSGCHLIAGLEDHALREGDGAISPWPDSNSSYCSDGSNKLECNADLIGDPALLTQDSLVRYNNPIYTEHPLNNGMISVSDSVTGLKWFALPASKGNWLKLSEDCQTAFAEQGVRLPTRLELVSLMDYGSSEPRFGPNAFRSLPQGDYITSSVTKRFPSNHISYPDQPEEVWTVNTGCASKSCAPASNPDALQATRIRYAMNNEYYAICVKEANPFELNKSPSPPSPQEMQWKDERSGLTWTTALESSASWKKALEHCNDKVLLGLSDWRLPSIKELHTIADDSRGLRDFMDINGMNDFILWSSTPYTAAPDFAYVITTPNSSAQVQPTNTNYFEVFCVRGPD